ncbi:MAG: tRNA (guanosine(46)-N7)-methyltransferase TrmB [Rhodospirillales bacterium]|nr:tRNA (guanosine(46)-N7)-methyltransferase TrmB [Rhodospirillales bacterium]
MSASASLPEYRKRLYGRRQGHSLRAHQQGLLKNLLPGLRVAIPGGGKALDPAVLFDTPPEDVWIEVGFGSGEHLVAQAEAHPGIGMIGCEPYINGVAALLAQIETQAICNIRILDDDARELFDVLPEAVLGRAFVLFGDPWPKRRHAKRRFLGRENLDALARMMKDQALLRFASDDMGYAVWTLEQLIAHPAFEWTARTPGDWRAPPADWVKTRYEAKARAAGRNPVYLDFRRLARP